MATTMNTAVKTVDEYIAGFPAATQLKLQQFRTIIKKAAPKATEVISYGIPTFVLEGNLVHFGGYKNHLGFYPGPAGITAFKEAFSIYKGSKGAIQFPIDKALPASLITKVVKFRVKQNLDKAAAKSTGKKKQATVKTKTTP